MIAVNDKYIKFIHTYILVYCINKERRLLIKFNSKKEIKKCILISQKKVELSLVFLLYNYICLIA